jgi:hypothetical protein
MPPMQGQRRYLAYTVELPRNRIWRMQFMSKTFLPINEELSSSSSFSSCPLHGLGSPACTGTHLFLGLPKS